uniref:Uncharacterized protein n=1 Tax=Myotis myotis TaxID=51298 RepID=A0A7J7Y0Q6_MYOMY|nr:hypothetical protein mMyoMyo1_011540 [Myotis myotis]
MMKHQLYLSQLAFHHPHHDIQLSQTHHRGDDHCSQYPRGHFCEDVLASKVLVQVPDQAEGNQACGTPGGGRRPCAASPRRPPAPRAACGEAARAPAPRRGPRRAPAARRQSSHTHGKCSYFHLRRVPVFGHTETVSASQGPSQPHRDRLSLTGTVQSHRDRFSLTGTVSASQGPSQPHRGHLSLRDRLSLAEAISDSKGAPHPTLGVKVRDRSSSRCLSCCSLAYHRCWKFLRAVCRCWTSYFNWSTRSLVFCLLLGSSLLDKISRCSCWLNIWYACLDFLFY